MAVNYQKVGIVLFAFVVGFNSAGLLLDAALFTVGFRTVSEFCARNQWAAALIIAINAVGLFGLAMHFSNLNGEE